MGFQWVIDPMSGRNIINEFILSLLPTSFYSLNAFTYYFQLHSTVEDTMR